MSILNKIINGMLNGMVHAVEKREERHQIRKDPRMAQEFLFRKMKAILETNLEKLSSGFIDLENERSLFYQDIGRLENPKQVRELLVMILANHCFGKDPKKIFENFCRARCFDLEAFFWSVFETVHQDQKLSQDFLRMFLEMYPEDFQEMFFSISPKRGLVVLESIMKDAVLRLYVTPSFLRRLVSHRPVSGVVLYFNACKSYPSLVDVLPLKEIFEALPKEEVLRFAVTNVEDSALSPVVGSFLYHAFSQIPSSDIEACFNFCKTNLSLVKGLPLETICQRIPRERLVSFLQEFVQDESSFAASIPPSEINKALEYAFYHMPSKDIFSCFNACKMIPAFSKEMPLEIIYKKIPRENRFSFLIECTREKFLEQSIRKALSEKTFCFSTEEHFLSCFQFCPMDPSLPLQIRVPTYSCSQ